MHFIPIQVTVLSLAEMFVQGPDAGSNVAGVQDADAFALEKGLEVIFGDECAFPGVVMDSWMISMEYVRRMRCAVKSVTGLTRN